MQNETQPQNTETARGKRSKTVKRIQIAVFALLCAAEAFFTYSTIGYLVVWFSQPRFVAVNGTTVSASLGFLIEFFLFAGFFLLTAAALIVCGILFFRKKPKKL